MPMNADEAVRSGMNALESCIAQERGKVDSLSMLHQGCIVLLKQNEANIKIMEALKKENDDLRARPKPRLVEVQKDTASDPDPTRDEN